MKITTQQLHAVLGNTEILRGIDFEANKGEFVGIIGPNGSGKSTLLRCLYRVLTPSEGAVFLDGKELSSYRVKESAQKLAVVAQHNYYNFEFSVRDVVMMGRAPHKRALDRDTAEDYQIMRQSLKAVGMQEFEERSFSTLSGGEQQRIILARALAQQTPCLILDEPTNHLDIKYQLWLMDIVRNLDCTVISAVHDLNIAAMYCDRLYAMKQGKVIAQGTPHELLTPDLIRELYEVDAEVSIDGKGQLRIFYCPYSRKEA
ncbi:MAG: ABC transporter ATP-binding protein [Negativibacillus massiliensis]|nr:ABC transporter ATP-binding protein [Negativibacillus massiliensis]